MSNSHERWKRQRRRHREIEYAVDDLAFGAENMKDALQPRSGCMVAMIALVTAAATLGTAVWEVL
jgi:hypothetical protein